MAPQVLGHPGAQFKGFKSLEDALAYMNKVPKGKGKEGSMSPNVHSVPETQRGRFLIVEDMKLYLLRTCVKLQIGSPIFDRSVFYDNQGLRMFAFTPAIRCDEKGINLEVESCFSPYEGKSRDDAAYQLLDKLLRQAGHSVCDFNYMRLYLAQ
ncbi:hypothetical protein PIB30_037639 [Stylosanthes scabra]|uniref:Uncharacterized protein n=1 Tax=Stylosanthes scabra TaxID=79078 RepID=A0ABU6RDW7_9FABA|nr:hypothetical protein [Stylosanthes scabra]